MNATEQKQQLLRKVKEKIMSKWEIDKSFSFCYGHRVFSQVINTDLTEKGHTCAKCRRLHGHEGLVKVFLEGDTLNPQGMVEDFVNLGWVKNFLDDNLDHKFIVSVDDPWFNNIVHGELTTIEWVETDSNSGDVTVVPKRAVKIGDHQHLIFKPVLVPGTNAVAGHELDIDSYRGQLTESELEVYQGFFIVDFVPTSENLAKWLYECIDAKMSQYGIKVSKISWNETPKSRAVYVG